MRIIPSCISATVWQHHMDPNKALGEKARWDLHKNVACCLEQILEAVSHKKIAVQTLAFNYTKHLGEANKTCWTLLENYGQTHN